MFAGIAAWAAGKLGTLGGKLAELIVALGLIIVLVGGPYWLGLRHQREVDQAATERAAATAAQRLSAAQARGELLAMQLAQARANARVVYRTIREEVPRVTVVYRPAPGAPLEPVPRAVFTVGFVGLWNRALFAGELPGAASESADSAAATHTADPALDAGITEDDVLRNHVDNAQICSDIRAQLEALIAWHHHTDAR